jgi:hypothetical protein
MIDFLIIFLFIVLIVLGMPIALTIIWATLLLIAALSLMVISLLAFSVIDLLARWRHG